MQLVILFLFWAPFNNQLTISGTYRQLPLVCLILVLSFVALEGEQKYICRFWNSRKSIIIPLIISFYRIWYCHTTPNKSSGGVTNCIFGLCAHVDLENSITVASKILKNCCNFIISRMGAYFKVSIHFIQYLCVSRLLRRAIISGRLR